MIASVDQSVRFIGINGSSRRNGTTATALSLAAQHTTGRGATFDTIHLVDHKILACRCGRCNYRDNPCPVDDDVGDIVHTMRQADALLYAAPVHGFGLSSLMQTFVERAGVGYLRFGRPLTNKVGGAVVIGRRYAHEHVHAQLIDNLLLNRLILPGSGFPATIRAGGPSDVEDDREGTSALLTMLDRMHTMAQLLKHSPMPDMDDLEFRLGTLS